MLHKLEKKLEQKLHGGGGADAGRVQALVAMGFPADRARTALKQTHGDVNAAANLLAGGGGGGARTGYPYAVAPQGAPVQYTPQYPGGYQAPPNAPAGGPAAYTPQYPQGYPYAQQPPYPPQQQPYYPPPSPGGYGYTQQQPGYYQQPPAYGYAQPPPQQAPPAAPAPAVGAAGFVPPTGRRKALLIGINYTGTRAQLRGCVNDVRRMRQFLSQRMGFPDTPQTMRVLTDDQHGANSPTRANILAAMQWLVLGAQPGDALFFHFSGHGGQQRDQTGMEEDGYDETILPLDFKHGHITDDQVWTALVQPLPSGVRLTAVMDCCHSGTGMDLAYNWTRHTGRWAEETNPAHAQADVRLFSGCEDAQTSADTSTIFEAGGAMTIAFLSALESGRQYTYRSLLDALHQHLRQRGFSQRPSLSSTQQFNIDSPVNLVDAVPNANPRLGRQLRKRKKPKRRLPGGLGDILIAGAVGYLAVSAAVGAADLLGGLVFGGLFD